MIIKIPLYFILNTVGKQSRKLIYSSHALQLLLTFLFLAAALLHQILCVKSHFNPWV